MEDDFTLDQSLKSQKCLKQQCRPRQNQVLHFPLCNKTPVLDQTHLTSVGKQIILSRSKAHSAKCHHNGCSQAGIDIYTKSCSLDSIREKHDPRDKGRPILECAILLDTINIYRPTRLHSLSSIREKHDPKAHYGMFHHNRYHQAGIDIYTKSHLFVSIKEKHDHKAEAKPILEYAIILGTFGKYKYIQAYSLVQWLACLTMYYFAL